MTTEEKVSSVISAMTQGERDDKSTFYHFKDTAPEELKDLFLENYNVQDQDYEIFADACSVFDSYTMKEIEDGDMDSEYAPVYTADRLALLNIANQDEISASMREIGSDIATACAYWYDNQVREAVSLIVNEYIKA